MKRRPLGGILYLVIAIGLAIAWTRGYLTPVTDQLSKLLSGPVQPNPIVIPPVRRFGEGAAAGGGVRAS